MKGFAGGLIALTLLAGCSDGTGPGDGELTQEEASSLLDTVDQWISDASNAAVWDAAGKFAADVPCQVKGKVSAAGSFSGDTLMTSGTFEKDSVSARIDFALDFQDCREASPDGPWTFDGKVTDLRTEQYNVPNDADDFHRETKGSLGWDFDGRSGVCEIALLLDSHSSPTSATRSVEGTVCGFDLETLIAGT